MSSTVSQDDVLGRMFKPEEKRVIRGQDPEEGKEKRRLITKLADALTYRRTVINLLPFACFATVKGIGAIKWGLLEETDPSRRELPPWTQKERDKAERAMKRLFRKDPPMNDMDVDDLKDILLKARSEWTRNGRDKRFATIVDSIPNRIQINKVICIGLSKIAIRYGGDKENMIVFSSTLAQYLAAMSIASYLRASVPHEIELFAADWCYNKAHKEALPSLGFTILNPEHGKQQQFAKIDNNTMLISFGIPDCESILPIISEYARPVAMIYDAYDYQINENHVRPQPSPVWSRVEYDDEWVIIPGPPLPIKEGFAGTPEAAKPESRHPFYTKSTGRMLDEYRIAMNLYEFDGTDLPSQFDLHRWHDDKLYPPIMHSRAEYSEIEQRRFAGKKSRLFVRK
ncbi:hypothetical protein F5Y07DRAFT_400073 [Xylaria sp. FL0933]|nr:hypothetical protein F5Y07DRAFT_400073 [Xylaria sp. FL0933]